MKNFKIFSLTALLVILSTLPQYSFALTYVDKTTPNFTDNSQGILSYLTEVSANSSIDANTNSLQIHPSGKYAYKVNYSGSIEIFSVDNSGVLTRLSHQKVRDRSERIIMHPSGKFLYLANMENIVEVFSISEDGNLTALPISVTPSGKFIRSMRIDKLGNYAYIACDKNFSVYKINPVSSKFTLIQEIRYVDSTDMINTIDFDNNGENLYLTFQYRSEISVFKVNKELGTVSNSSLHISVPGSVKQLFFDPSGKFVYALCSNGEYRGQILTYTIDRETGSLIEKDNISINGYPEPSISIHPSGKYLYVSQCTDDHKSNIAVFNRDDKTGALTTSGIQPISTVLCSMNMIISEDKKKGYVYSFNQFNLEAPSIITTYLIN